MDVEEAIMTRRSVRSYKDEKIPKEKIEQIMNAARTAPSARNRQEWKFVVVTDEKKKEEVYEASMKQKHVKEAAAVVVGIDTDPSYDMTCGIPGGTVDLAIALDHLSLKATEEGIGTCWIGAFEQDKIKEILNIPQEYEVVSMMILGYPNKPLEKTSKRRKSLEEVMSYDIFED